MNIFSTEAFRELALSFDEVTEAPNLDKNTFKVDDKIFVTIDNKNAKAIFKLSVADQNLYSDFDPSAIYPAPAGWGKQGWTIFEINFIEAEKLKEALTKSYCTVAPEKLAKKHSN
ncbi:MmcQ/YjbR family DNA-binding protein [Pedobacter jamesrossensis]|uniref:MmcQ/YjbR family DNA-binding protein n=1 Tax=Pedobacter jamesrossensis TaxID=1908238 RepID=A0ABV8NLP0_9SPHI